MIVILYDIIERNYRAVSANDTESVVVFVVLCHHPEPVAAADLLAVQLLV